MKIGTYIEKNVDNRRCIIKMFNNDKAHASCTAWGIGSIHETIRESWLEGMPYKAPASIYNFLLKTSTSVDMFWTRYFTEEI